MRGLEKQNAKCSWQGWPAPRAPRVLTSSGLFFIPAFLWEPASFSNPHRLTVSRRIPRPMVRPLPPRFVQPPAPAWGRGERSVASSPPHPGHRGPHVSYGSSVSLLHVRVGEFSWGIGLLRASLCLVWE